MVLITHFVFICMGTMISGLDDEAKHTESFGKLLNSIVQLNEKKMDAITKLNNLQQYTVATKLRVGREIEGNPKDGRPVLLIYADEKPQLRTKSKNKINISKKDKSAEFLKRLKNSPEKNKAVQSDNDSSEEEMLTKAKNYKKQKTLNIGKEENILLRKSWRSACDKKATKKCRVACCKAYKNICSSYKCKSKLKKNFKKGCKRSCKASFRSSGSSGSDSSSSGSD